MAFVGFGRPWRVVVAHGVMSLIDRDSAANGSPPNERCQDLFLSGRIAPIRTQTRMSSSWTKESARTVEDVAGEWFPKVPRYCPRLIQSDLL
jgi:hypothetical protein